MQTVLTIREVCEEILYHRKPYVSIGMKQNTFGNIIRRIHLGKAKPCTITDLFNKCGYEGSFNAWKKVSDPFTTKRTACIEPVVDKDKYHSLMAAERTIVRALLAADTEDIKAELLASLCEIDSQLQPIEKALPVWIYRNNALATS